MRNDQKALAELYSRIITESNGNKIIRGDVILKTLYLKELPEWLADVEVKNDFICSYNQLTSLKGSPRIVRGTFKCVGNRLTSLEGAPEIVGETFDCSNCRLTSLVGAPQKQATSVVIIIDLQP